MKTLHCSDAGFDCKAVIHATTTEEVLNQAAVHVKEAHGLTATPELAKQLETLIKDE
jgi:predicted small metal-binding protein